MFTDTNIKITTEGRKHLGAVVGSDTQKVQYVEDLVNDLNMHLKLLSVIAESQLQTTYLAILSGFRCKLNYFMRIIPEINHHLVRLEERLRNKFTTAIAGGQIVNNTQRKLLSLPIHSGGFAILFHKNKQR